MKKSSLSIDNTSPITATKKKLRLPKTWIFLWLSLIAYGLIFYTLFGQFLILRSMIFVMLFFLFFHFFYLQVRKLPIKYLLVIMLAITIIQSFFIGYDHLRLLASLLIFNSGIVYVARFLQGESHDKTYFSSQGYFNAWGYMFTVFVTIAYSCFIVGYYEKFPFSCEYLSEASNSVIDTVTTPFKVGIEEVKNIKNATQNFFATKWWDVINITKNITIKTWEENPKFLDKISIYKTQLINQTIEDNSKVNMGICDYVLGEINNIYNVPGVKVSVIALMFLLLYGFIRIEFWIMTGIAMIIFKILYRFNIYRIKKILREVEELE